MPNYAVPGVPTTRPEATRTGVVVVVLAVAILLVWLGPLTSADDPRMHVVVETELLGDGVGEGTSVRSRGVDVGTVEGVTAAGNGIVTLDLALDRDRLFGIDDSLRVDYAPSNLFGISGVELVSGPGGAELRDGTTIDLTGPRAGDVYDATMSALLRQFSSITGQALTPQLTSALTQLSAGIDSFAPLLRAGIAVASVVEETQWMPASELAGEYGRAATGLGDFTAATIGVFDVLRSNQPLREDREHFDATVDAIVNDLLPAGTALGLAGEDNLTGFTNLVVPLLNAATASVSTPQRTSAELAELLRRLNRGFTDGPAGPVLQAEVNVDTAPGVAHVLLGPLASMAAPKPVGE